MPWICVEGEWLALEASERALAIANGDGHELLAMVGSLFWVASLALLQVVGFPVGLASTKWQSTRR